MLADGPPLSEPGPILPGETPCRFFGMVVPPLSAGAALLLISACMPTGPDARREAYLDCARDQGLTVEDGTIRTGSAADLRRLDACQAVPR
ncbi:hypothetical protein [Jannaschia donghaensis]|uniref:Uncharacterized protein n=1 Tax=Jannaschia donghaensis TaxID=420998 RepID=A0A0M6YI95_9RHOB|nr:hypothetical protein [Jannaschia donghaensis]CTQ48997.1 hypothetical protein JDO7802_01005 [Jannaschia donghaensis]